MVLFNYATRELTAKIVYYGPGLCGKTTNLQYIHENLPQDVRGKMLSLATKTDRTLFFDFLPIDLGQIRGMKTRVQLYTVPGQVFYNETRKLVLKGADGIVFVADSQEAMLGANSESFRNLEENLRAHGMKLGELPHVIQFNKRDLPKLASIEQLNAAINRYNAPFYEAVATTGIGVQDTLKAISKLVLLSLTQKYDPTSPKRSEAAAPEAPAAAAAAQPAAPAAGEAIPVQPAEPTAPPAGEAIPLSLGDPEPLELGEAPVTAAAIGDQDVDALVDEVEQAGEIPIELATEDAAPDPGPAAFEVDPSFVDTPAAEPAEQPLAAAPLPELDLEPTVEPAVQPSATGGGPQSVSTGAEPAPPQVHAVDVTGDAEPDDANVVLTEVAAEHALFNDPAMQVAKLAAGEVQEIVVPVEVGDGPSARRFTLSIRLSVDSVD